MSHIDALMRLATEFAEAEAQSKWDGDCERASQSESRKSDEIRDSARAVLREACEKLCGALEKLPQTADGEPITPNMMLYIPVHANYVVKARTFIRNEFDKSTPSIEVICDPFAPGERERLSSFPASKCFTTEAAALAHLTKGTA